MNRLYEFKIKMNDDDTFRPALLPLIIGSIQRGDATVASMCDKLDLTEHAVMSFVSFLDETGIAKFVCDRVHEDGIITGRIKSITDKIISDTGIVISIEETCMYVHPTHMLTTNITGDMWVASWGYDIVSDVMTSVNCDNIDEDVLDVIVWHAIIDDVEALHADGFFDALVGDNK